MLEISTLSVFLLAAGTLCIIPGPAVLFVVTRSVDQGRRAGLLSVTGIALGNVLHTVAAALGLSALLTSSALAFGVVKMAGAAYLIYLGVRSLFDRSEVAAQETGKKTGFRRVFIDGIIVQVLNPKVALFLFAFLPQFVDPAAGDVRGQVLMLGFLFSAIALITDALYAVAAGSLSRWLKRNLHYLKSQRYFSGVIYIGLGVATALGGSDNR